MVVAFLIGILDEEHVVDDAEQGVAETVVLLVLLLGVEIALHLELGVELRLQTVAVTADAV